jgi:hypothetical protein
MDDRLSHLESTLSDLTRTVGALEHRLAALEARGGAIAAQAEAPPSVASIGAGAVAAPTSHDLVGVLALLGRLFIVLGGGYLLRAMTESGRLAPEAGILAGLAYAVLWTMMADRAARRGQKLAADFHGVATALIAFPLVWEATSRFNVLSPWQSAAVLAALAALCLTVAWRRRLQTLAWVAVSGALPSAIALIAGTQTVVPYALVLILLGVATLWMGYSLDWRFLRWPVAAVADLVVFGLTLRALSAQPHEPAGVVIAVQLFLLAAYLISIAVRTLVRGRNVIPFEVVQTLAALALGFGGAVSVERHSGAGVGALGAASLVFSAACYGVTFAFIDRQQTRGRNVYFYASLAIVFMLAGTDLVLGETMNTATWSALGVVTAWLWARYGRLALGLHSGLYLFAAAVVSGTVNYGAVAFFGTGDGWQVPSGGAIVVMLAGLVAAWLSTSGLSRGADGYSRIPRLAIILVLVWAGGAALVGWLARGMGATSTGAIDPGVLATVRTSVLAVATLLVAWIGSRARYLEWGWLVYPLLVVTGFKMVIEDFMKSRPITLSIALALYGAALLLAPRIRRARAVDEALAKSTTASS